MKLIAITLPKFTGTRVAPVRITYTPTAGTYTKSGGWVDIRLAR